MTLDATQRHYQTLLAPIYRWMLGDLPAAYERSRFELESLGVGRAQPGARALDLGAGLGLQSIPLCDAGYGVTAIDSSPTLLAELSAERANVTAVVGDVLAVDTLAPGAFDVIVCMGDTLTHLPSEPDVARLLARACQKLKRDGKLILTFRDYATRALEATQRFILVRGDANRILTCCLDYGPERVQVTDLVHERNDNGWTLRASTYPKLRLRADWVRAQIEAQACTVTQLDATGGRICIAARGC